MVQKYIIILIIYKGENISLQHLQRWKTTVVKTPAMTWLVNSIATAPVRGGETCFQKWYYENTEHYSTFQK